ncbi:MAG: bifunctional 4-hydroxy-3-methylbut-2-enyl diphosphate reductase/30S ribosomal protein S1 [Clostridiales bacterium]|nr:bifunctional 4-hydroxy-3-methylbut-2-enyl diphosphate reductase/30S ribosomal protein S1 [Clostridiales bacterium]MCF8023228.1 bifunctional 4-hydroxy-3-methylbut-2-enyl diphosphate reductase/30S ribosomal protein S1 [Clostridiales bacterium]
MRVYIAAKAGFCFGVKRAIDMAVQSARNRDGPLCSLGPLIHNPQVVNSLSKQGINVIEDVEQAGIGSALVIRSHGVAPELHRRAENLNIEVIDATCPFVSKAQQTAQKLMQEGFQVVIVGEKSHPEVRGLVGWSSGTAIVVKDEHEAGLLSNFDSIGVIAQTTQSRERFHKAVEVLKSKCDRIQVWDTICHATGERQQAAVELAEQVGIMIVVGGYNSANTKKLAMLCRTTSTPTYHVEVAEELNPQWFKGVKDAGLTAGASTPDWIIEEVYRYMKAIDDFNKNESEEEVQTPEAPSGSEEQAAEETPEPVVEETPEPVVEDTPEPAAEDTQTDQGMDEAVDVKSLRPGDIVKGTVVQVANDEVLVDVGVKSEGVVPLKELSCYSINSPQEIVQQGDEIDVLALKNEDSEGRLILSKQRADAEKSWPVLKEKMDNGEPVEGVVREVVKGGLLVDLGLRAFLPASLVEIGYVEDLQQYVGQDIMAKVIELNRSRKKVILSRKEMQEEEKAQNRKEILEDLEEGDTAEGVVRRLTNFGAFIDIGGIDGLLHISEMAWYRIEHPSDVVNVGDELKVKILRLDKENEKVSLGLKQVLPSPWEGVDQKYPVDSEVEVEVVRLAPFGAFVRLEPGVEGLVHISQLAEHHVSEPSEIVSEEDNITVRVLSVDTEEKRIRLSLKDAGKIEKERQKEPEKPARAPKKEQPKAQPKKAPQQGYSQDNSDESDGGAITIGEMVGDIFKDKNYK